MSVDDPCSNVSQNASSVLLSAANAARREWFVFNDSSATLYVRFGGTSASTSSFTVKIAAAGYYEIPHPCSHKGAIYGIWSGSGGGAARITEVVRED